MKLFNTLTKKLEELQINNNTIKIYLCGVTVYDNSHIGHARTIIVFDVIRRLLLSKKINVEFIQNFTDIDDKIIDRANKEGLKYNDISEKFINNYFSDFDALNVLRATYYPRVTDHIDEIITFIKDLISKNNAYLALNGVFFRVSSFQKYGRLSNKPVESVEAGARIEIDNTKDDPRDFALWKFFSSKPSWNSPWGTGRPGWHIECSVMATKYLGNHIDIHGGGQDLIFPHHENEIAQSESYSGVEFAKIWVHIGMVTINSEKMSKSLGNTIKISDLLLKFSPNVIRLFCLSSHYSKPLNYSNDILSELENKWKQIEITYYELFYRIYNKNRFQEFRNIMIDLRNELNNYYIEFEKHLENDLNFSLAMASFFKFINKVNNELSKNEFGYSVSLFIFDILCKFFFILGIKMIDISDKEINEIQNFINKRNDLRSLKKYKESDMIREVLLKKYNVDLIDHKGYTVWKKNNS